MTEQKKLKMAAMKQRQTAFQRELFDGYGEQYSEDLLDDFFDYWTEPNKSRTRMKFELQTTWDTARRLRTWERNAEKFNRRNNCNNTQSLNPKTDRYEKRRRIEPTAKTADDYKTGF